MALERRQPLLSYADFLQLPPETPGEVIDGELIVTPSPTPRNQRIADTILRFLGNFLDDHPELGAVFSAPLDVVLRAELPAVVVQPDVLFVSAEREHIIGDAVNGAPDLAVEVVSPSAARIDNVRKRDLYAAHGVREYWLVWPDEERIDVFTLGESPHYGTPRSLGPGDGLTSALLPGFELDVARVLARRGGR